MGWQAPLGQTAAGPIRVGGMTHHHFWNDGGLIALAAVVVTVPVTKTVAIDLVGIPRLENATYARLHVALSWRFR